MVYVLCAGDARLQLAGLTAARNIAGGHLENRARLVRATTSAAHHTLITASGFALHLAAQPVQPLRFLSRVVMR